MVHIELSKCGRMNSELETHPDAGVTQGLIDAGEASPGATLEDDPGLNVAPAIDIGRCLRSQDYCSLGRRISSNVCNSARNAVERR